ncbi:MAG: nitronate monooxygenase [Betaproteobacteria bacterium]|nr:nitronate monooxygenase [Betaproteobacteria bacterium]
MPLPRSLAGRRKLPVIAAPMVLTSAPDLVIACSNAGIVGTFPALNQRGSEGLGEWFEAIRAGLSIDAAPFAVNLIVRKTNPRVAADLALRVRHKVPVIITSLGAATEVVDAVHSYGGAVFHVVTTAKHARKAAEAGVDGPILVASGAGGHAGTLNPTALMAEVRAFFDKTIILSGCISTGGDIAAAPMLGAHLGYMGTRFIATTESMAADANKQMLADAGASDIVCTPAISSIAAKFLRASIVDAGLDPDRLAAPAGVDLSHIIQPYKKDPEKPESKAWRDIWSAGQGVASIHDVLPAARPVARLRAEYRARVDAFKSAAGPSPN